MSSCLFDIEFPWATVSLEQPVDAEAAAQFSQWLAQGKHGSMSYMEKYADLRLDPRTLLPGAKSMLCVAFPYYTTNAIKLPISVYARGRDYHEVVRERLLDIAHQLPTGDVRICVDTAPLRERYWAARAGLGFIGKNNQLIIPSLGSYFFLGFILTTAELPEIPGKRIETTCGNCQRCIDACPGKCIFSNGAGIDARKCLSYLTIEHRGDLPEDLKLPVLYGCDMCQKVCPHNQSCITTTIKDFHPSAELANLTAADVASMTAEQFSALFRHSAIKRTKLSGLQRNLKSYSNN